MQQSHLQKRFFFYKFCKVTVSTVLVINMNRIFNQVSEKLDSHPFDKICDVSCCNDLKKYLRIS